MVQYDGDAYDSGCCYCSNPLYVSDQDIRLYEPLSPGDVDHNANLLLDIAAVSSAFSARGI